MPADKDVLFLEPCVGNFALFNEWARTDETFRWKFNDLFMQKDNPAVSNDPAQEWLWRQRVHRKNFSELWTVTNPPFSESLEITDVALQMSTHVIMLQRLNWLGSKKRNAWWQENPPKGVMVLPKRPSFTGKGTDACEYGWFCWGQFEHFGIKVLPYPEDA
jgi:hypothetical protein